jgi:hypothetical protein
VAAVTVDPQRPAKRSHCSLKFRGCSSVVLLSVIPALPSFEAVLWWLLGLTLAITAIEFDNNNCDSHIVYEVVEEV